MTDKQPPAGKPLSLSDADISSEPAVTRRSLLGVLGVGAGIAAAVALGTANSVHAADDSDKTEDDKDDDKDTSSDDKDDKDDMDKEKGPPPEEDTD